ncbi:Na+/H+ antiporter subunit E [Coriobacteriia bacterium Es71-Z0120]|uniref:Na+/H+ antiporter subunit E n=1 Tax=Parvivirga hydrogeniphila TaxID=2939460 RepID=UPI002260EABE|nr:Na+/H+ antiporter subunit E [Parvivirga hydrogeniphila]MCL4078649.1 Na+/H+ antiporter subunit E [Parvivirga hydrogeniphila]
MKTGQCAALLAVFWFILVGRQNVVSDIVGLLAAVLIASWASSRLWAQDEPPVLGPVQWLRFVGYVLRLVRDIVAAAVVVAEKVLDPRMPIEPVLIAHRAKFDRQVSRVALANSITLTPGTLTVDVDGDQFLVHCLAEEFAEDIVNGTFERRIRRVFEER